MNYLLVGGVMSLEQQVPLLEALRRLQPGMLTDFTLTLVAGGVLGVLVGMLYQGLGWPALLAFLAPILLGQLVVNRSQMVVDTTRAHRSAEKALVRLEHQIYEERTDERRLIAADLHDEVLQPLFKVSLMAHVLKADLASGRLLEMDADLPELLSAAEEASNTLRELIGDLRRSALGTGGLSVALARLTETIRPQEAEIRSYIEEVEPEPVAQLALYQIAKEALSNATTHSRARKIEVRLTQDQDHWIIEVIDDGNGFDPAVEHTGHFGLAVMMERAAALGGAFYLDTAPGMGCRIRAILPKVTAQRV
jgi:signal transduction histidine kinase